MQEITFLQRVIETLAPWLIIILVPFLFWKVPVWKSRIEVKIENIEDNIEKLDSKYEKIIQFFIDTVGHPLVKSTSPLTLTDHGVKISEKIYANEIVDKYANNLSAEVKELNAYEIQEYCFDYCKNKLLTDLKNNDQNKYETIHTVAYEDGIDVKKILV